MTCVISPLVLTVLLVYLSTFVFPRFSLPTLQTRRASAGIGNTAKGGAIFVVVLIVSSIVYGWVAGPVGLDPMGHSKISLSLFVFGVIIFIVWRFALSNLPKQIKPSGS